MAEAIVCNRMQLMVVPISANRTLAANKPLDWLLNPSADAAPSLRFQRPLAKTFWRLTDSRRLLAFPFWLFEDAPGRGNAMRKFHVVFASVTLCSLAGCSTAPKVDLTPVTSSPLPSMQKYNGYIGKDYWVTGNLLQLCEGPTSLHCLEFLRPGTHLKVDGLVPNHSEVGGTSIDQPYFHVVMDDGRSGFADALILPMSTTTIDPVVAAAECKRKGDPKLGMNAAQVAATCWGPPHYVNTKIRKNGKYEQYIYGDNKLIYLRNGIVTSVSVKGPQPNSDQFMH